MISMIDKVKAIFCKSNEAGLLDSKMIIDSDEIEESINQGIIQVEYSHSIVATAGGDRSYRIGIYQAEDGNYQLNVYNGNQQEQCFQQYHADLKLLNEIKELIEKKELKSYKDKRYDFTDGASSSIYFEDNGELICISNDNLPQELKEVISQIRNLLEQGIQQSQRIG